MKLIGYAALALMLAALFGGASAHTETMKAIGFGSTLLLMPVTACALLASVAFPKDAPIRA